MIKTSKKPAIVSYDLDHSVYSATDTITFKYWINNPFANDFSDVRLGAQIRTVNPQSNWIDDWNNDKVITLNSGTYEHQREYERLFKIPTPATEGYYDAHWVILNHNTGIWYDYKEKANAFIIPSPPNPIIIDPTPTPSPSPTPTPTPTPTPPALDDQPPKISGWVMNTNGGIQRAIVTIFINDSLTG